MTSLHVRHTFRPLQPLSRTWNKSEIAFWYALCMCIYVMCFKATKGYFSIINLELWLKQTVFCDTVEDGSNRSYKRFVVCRRWRTTVSNFKFYWFDTVVLSSEVIRESYSSTLFFPCYTSITDLLTNSVKN